MISDKFACIYFKWNIAQNYIYIIPPFDRFNIHQCIRLWRITIIVYSCIGNYCILWIFCMNIYWIRFIYLSIYTWIEKFNNWGGTKPLSQLFISFFFVFDLAVLLIGFHGTQVLPLHSYNFLCGLTKCSKPRVDGLHRWGACNKRPH